MLLSLTLVFYIICFFPCFTTNVDAIHSKDSEPGDGSPFIENLFKVSYFSAQGIENREILNCLDQSQALDLSNSSVVSTPRLSVSNNNVFVVWEEGKAGKSNIFFRYSNDSGVTFGPAINMNQVF